MRATIVEIRNMFRFLVRIYHLQWHFAEKFPVIWTLYLTIFGNIFHSYYDQRKKQ